MSMEALLLSVQDAIRTGLDYSPGQCGVQPDGAPNPWNGQYYLAIHPLDIRDNGSQGLRLDEMYSVGATITMRTGLFPKDRLGAKVVAKASTGIYARAEAIRALVHMNETIRAAANTEIGAGENGFLTPLEFQGIGMLMKQGPDWFSSPMRAPDHAITGYSLEVRFGGANRVQKIELQS